MTTLPQEDAGTDYHLFNNDDCHHRDTTPESTTDWLSKINVISATQYSSTFGGGRGRRSVNCDEGLLETIVVSSSGLLDTRWGRVWLGLRYGRKFEPPQKITPQALPSSIMEATRTKYSDTGNNYSSVTLCESAQIPGLLLVTLFKTGSWGQGIVTFDGSSFRDIAPGYFGKETVYRIQIS